MPLFRTLGRLLKGEPPYTPDQPHIRGESPEDRLYADETAGEHQNHASETPLLYAAATPGAKVMPKVEIEEVKSHLNGDRLEVYGYIRNESPYDVSLDKIIMLGTKREIDATLRAGEKREFLLYSATAPQNQSYHDAELQFFDNAPTRDYFVSKHDVFFKPESGKYLVERMRFSGLKDI